MGGGLTYTRLPETTCAAIRGCVDGFGIWRDEPENFGVTIKTTEGSVFVTRDGAAEYVEACRKSGLWRLQGYVTPTPPTGDQS